MDQSEITAAETVIREACAELTALMVRKGFRHGRVTYFGAVTAGPWRVERDQTMIARDSWHKTYADAAKMVDQTVARTIIEAQREAIASKLSHTDADTLAKIAETMGLSVERAA